MSHNTIKVYLAGIRLEYIERGLPDPTQDKLLHLVCTGIKRSQGDKRRTCLPIIISILCLLKTQLRQQTSFSLLEKYLLWVAFTLVFYGFLRASEFSTNDLTWSDLQLDTNHYSLVWFSSQKQTHFAAATSWKFMSQKHQHAQWKLCSNLSTKCQVIRDMGHYSSVDDSCHSASTKLL